jgi:hypothetical protein
MLAIGLIVERRIDLPFITFSASYQVYIISILYSYIAGDLKPSRHWQSELLAIFLRRLNLLLAQNLDRILRIYITRTTPHRRRSHQIPVTLIYQPLPQTL